MPYTKEAVELVVAFRVVGNVDLDALVKGYYDGRNGATCWKPLLRMKMLGDKRELVMESQERLAKTAAKGKDFLWYLRCSVGVRGAGIWPSWSVASSETR